VPRGYPQEHPRSELLKYKNLYASVQGIAPEIVTSSDFLGVCVEHFETMLPLHKWLVALGDSMMD